jgi:lipopolysaccharide transport system ATP-binding protein
MKPILEVQNISKKFLIQHQQLRYLSFRDKLSGLFTPKEATEEFWALHDISFDVQPGESIGIIGRNGAGKSTLLKILSRITPPTTGRITVRGRIASLLEVGTGFHQELTGRENIFMNGSILGMKHAEIKAKFDEIVDFSGTEKFLDTPLKHYSSGMQLRLAFAVAAHLEPEILIIDEVLAVGDAEFQKKCIGKMETVNKSGKTILFVSHNMAAVGNLCRRAILIEKGGLKKQGTVSEIIHDYQAASIGANAVQWSATNPGKSAAYINQVALRLAGAQPSHTLSVKTGIVSQARHKDLFVAYDISNSIGVPVLQAIPKLQPFIRFSETEQIIETEIELPPMIPDQYKVSVWIGEHNTETMCWEKEVVAFEISESPAKGRNFPHSHGNGFIVPNSRIVNA